MIERIEASLVRARVRATEPLQRGLFKAGVPGRIAMDLATGHESPFFRHLIWSVKHEIKPTDVIFHHLEGDPDISRFTPRRKATHAVALSASREALNDVTPRSVRYQDAVGFITRGVVVLGTLPDPEEPLLRPVGDIYHLGVMARKLAGPLDIFIGRKTLDDRQFFVPDDMCVLNDHLKISELGPDRHYDGALLV